MLFLSLKPSWSKNCHQNHGFKSRPRGAQGKKWTLRFDFHLFSGPTNTPQKGEKTGCVDFEDSNPPELPDFILDCPKPGRLKVPGNFFPVSFTVCMIDFMQPLTPWWTANLHLNFGWSTGVKTQQIQKSSDNLDIRNNLVKQIDICSTTLLPSTTSHDVTAHQTSNSSPLSRHYLLDLFEHMGTIYIIFHGRVTVRELHMNLIDAIHGLATREVEASGGHGLHCSQVSQNTSSVRKIIGFTRSVMQFWHLVTTFHGFEATNGLINWKHT